MIPLPEVQRLLSLLPSKIARQTEIMEKEKTAFDLAKKTYERNHAIKALEIKFKDPTITATFLKYHLLKDDALHKELGELTTIYESAYKAEECRRDELVNDFYALRKISDSRLYELKTLGG